MESKLIDTNVLIVASVANPESDSRTHYRIPLTVSDQNTVYQWLTEFQISTQSIVMDNKFYIFKEYQNNLSQQDYGYMVFFNKLNQNHVLFVDIDYDANGHAVLSPELNEVIHDPSDRKFVAAALQAGKESSCEIINATDTDWLQWQELLRQFSIYVNNLLPEWLEKMKKD
jgi:hypothetical protein